MATKPLPTPEVLRQLLSYDPVTGSLTWLTAAADLFSPSKARTAEHICALWNSKYSGRLAFTSLDSHGYIHGTVLGRNVKAHRTAWAIMTGEWPSLQVDHINGIRSDNSWANLRVATNKENGWNSRPRLGSSRFKGVYLNQNGKWVANICSGRKTKYLGSFINDEDAARAYDAAAIEMALGYARLNFPCATGSQSS